ncbi:hypothetical protein [Mycolicibacterium komossense]|uniref:hypothetical protein n=1 Tax=Mycolicibacterium komossense TaxID=1779 RepID=UPI0021F38960|nr:hypothetical protein [Mycolicibacterium komossense]
MGVTLDWDWAQRTGGNLSPREHCHLVGAILRDVPGALVGVVRYRLGRRSSWRIPTARTSSARRSPPSRVSPSTTSRLI